MKRLFFTILTIAVLVFVVHVFFFFVNGYNNFKPTITEAECEKRLEAKKVYSQSNNHNTNQQQQEYQNSLDESSYYHRSNSPYAVTLVTITTTSRVDRVKTNVERWRGPISIVLSVRHNQMPFNEEFTSWDEAYFPQSPKNEHKKSIVTKEMDDEAHRVRSFQKYIQKRKSKGQDIKIFIYHTYQPVENFPFNVLRNIAISQVETKMYFYIDADFIITPNAYNNLQNKPEDLDRVMNDNTVLVFPAFEVKRKISNVEDIENKENLRKFKSKYKKQLKPFHENVGWHTHTNFTKWWQPETTETYEIKWSLESVFEPYFVAKFGAPVYDEWFLGRGCNKVAQVWELNRRGYKFRVMPDEFLIHLPHPKVAPGRRTNKIVNNNCRYFQEQFLAHVEAEVKD